jgi:hypothetical protein
MAAMATKKPLGDMGLSVTFPAVFQTVFSGGVGYFPSNMGSSFPLMIGTDFQSQYHEQKRLDAIQSVMNGLQSKRSAEVKLLTGIHNYHLPKPVLGQRRYANPSMGAEAYSSTRRDNGPLAPFRMIEVGQEMGGGLVGGGVHTLEGQLFYKKQLNDRIAQLDRLNAVAQGFTVRMGQTMNTADNTKEGSVDKVQFFLYLRTLMDTITEGDLSRFSFENLKELMRMLFNFGPQASDEDFKDIIEATGEILESLRDGLSEEPDAAKPVSYRAYADTLLLFTKAINTYTTQMYRNINLSTRDRETLSKSLTKSLGFTSLLRKSTPKDVVETAKFTNQRLAQSAEDYDEGPDDGEFDIPRVAREDSEQNMAPRAPFAGQGGDPSRDAFGRTMGSPSFFGEDMAQDMAPPIVAPLGSSGFDPNAQAPTVDTNSLKTAVIDAITHLLGNVTAVAVTTDNMNQLIETNYPDKAILVTDIEATLVEKGFTPAQIAEGMALTKEPYFADYIAANAGDLRPAPSAPAYRQTADLSLPTMMYQDPSMAEGGPAPAPVKKQSKLRPLTSLGIPATRERLREDFDTITKLRALWQSLPEEIKDRSKQPPTNMLVSNAQKRIIKLIGVQYTGY